MELVIDNERVVEAMENIKETLKKRRAKKFKSVDASSPAMFNLVKEMILSYEINEKDEISGFIDFLFTYYMFYRKEKLSIRKKEFRRDRTLFIEYINRIFANEPLEDYKKYSHIHGIFITYLSAVDKEKKMKYEEEWVKSSKIRLYLKELKKAVNQ